MFASYERWQYSVVWNLPRCTKTSHQPFYSSHQPFNVILNEGGGILGDSFFIDLFALPTLERQLSSPRDGIDIDVDFDIFGQPHDFHFLKESDNAFAYARRTFYFSQYVAIQLRSIEILSKYFQKTSQTLEQDAQKLPPTFYPIFLIFKSTPTWAQCGIISLSS